MSAPPFSFGPETHSFEIPEYLCGGYGLLVLTKLGLLGTALGAAGFVITREISRTGLTALAGLVMVPFRSQSIPADGGT